MLPKARRAFGAARHPARYSSSCRVSCCLIKSKRKSQFQLHLYMRDAILQKFFRSLAKAASFIQCAGIGLRFDGTRCDRHRPLLDRGTSATQRKQKHAAYISQTAPPRSARKSVLRPVPFIPPQIPPCLHCRRRAVHLPLHFFLLGHGALIPSSFAAFCTYTLHRLRSTETPGMSFSMSPFSTGCTAAVTLPERSTYTMPANTSPSCTAISSSEKRQTFAAHSEHRP